MGFYALFGSGARGKARARLEEAFSGMLGSMNFTLWAMGSQAGPGGLF